MGGEVQALLTNPYEATMMWFKTFKYGRTFVTPTPLILSLESGNPLPWLYLRSHSAKDGNPTQIH